MFCSPAIARKAAKQHKCTFCGEPIFAGERYTHWVSVDDGEFFTSKMHPECLAALRENYRLYGDCEYDAFVNDRPDNQGEKK